jgi:hypothetical protein
MNGSVPLQSRRHQPIDALTDQANKSVGMGWRQRLQGSEDDTDIEVVTLPQVATALIPGLAPAAEDDPRPCPGRHPAQQRRQSRSIAGISRLDQAAQLLDDCIQQYLAAGVSP